MSPAVISMAICFAFALVAIGGAFLSAHGHHEMDKVQKRRSSDKWNSG